MRVGGATSPPWIRRSVAPPTEILTPHRGLGFHDHLWLTQISVRSALNHQKAITYVRSQSNPVSPVRIQLRRLAAL